MTQYKTFIALSGGVDSAVAALLLHEAGHRVEALFMKNWEEDDTDEECTAAEDLQDAKAVCETLGIPLHTVNFSHEYWERVFEYFLAELKRGRTPNPDILCNREIKFAVFWDHARDLGAQLMATGHYAGLREISDQVALVKAADPNKDQTYFLYALRQQQLKHACFPLANYQKSAIRDMAKDAKLPVHDKRDSTGICFIGERRFKEFLASYLPAQPGDIVTTEQQVIGTHQGLMYYTLGQRRGIGLGGIKDAAESPWYVVDKDLADNRLIVAQGTDHPRLYRSQLTADELNWIAGVAPAEEFECKAKSRYRQSDQACRVRVHGGRAEVDFAHPQRALTTGQSIVFYQDDVCLGGGVIDTLGETNA